MAPETHEFEGAFVLLDEEELSTIESGGCVCTLHPNDPGRTIDIGPLGSNGRCASCGTETGDRVMHVAVDEHGVSRLRSGGTIVTNSDESEFPDVIVRAAWESFCGGWA